MAKILDNTADFSVQLTDSATGAPLAVSKVVEITDDCLGLDPDERAILLFTEAQRGQIVQLLLPYAGQSIGVTTHFFVDELGNELAQPEGSFGYRAGRIGLTPIGLRDLILEHAPAPVVDDIETCIACAIAFKDGDLVYDDVSGGSLHAACCGPERECYVGDDGERLKDGEPIPEPYAWRPLSSSVTTSDRGGEK